MWEEVVMTYFESTTPASTYRDH